MPEIMCKASGVVAVIGELIPRRMSQHVGMHREGEFRGAARALNHPQEPSWRLSSVDPVGTSAWRPELAAAVAVQQVAAVEARRPPVVAAE
jgi:dihydrodipicolinate synthase/N-acetylneuraminate lyase